MSGGIPKFDAMSIRRRRDMAPGHIVQAQPIKDSSYMESMVNFLHDIGQVYTNTTQIEEKETVLWARIFDYEHTLDPESDSFLEGKKQSVIDSFLLVLGYKNGIQAWNFNENGNMQEMFSLRQGPVKTACLVPPPKSSSDHANDTHNIARPLLAICMAADRKQLFTSISILSLRTQDQVHMLKFDDDVEQIRTGMEGMLFITLRHEIRVIDTFDFSLLLTIKDCYPSPNVDRNPIAVGNKWLAYSPAKHMPSFQSAGGMEDDGINSYAATVLSAAKTIKKGLVNLTETVNWLAKTSMSSGEEHTANSLRETGGQRSRNQSGGSLPELSDGIPGLVTVVDVAKLLKNFKDVSSPSTPVETVINGVLPTEAIVSHFRAHTQPVVCMEFSPCGSLIATADKRGHSFHIFSILPHPINPKMGAVHHLYSLYRGDTSAKVQEISFSGDCRWLSVSTLRGTSHIFPITAYGGPATVRTHASHRVVNRSSLFHKSAGLEDMDPSLVTLNNANHSIIDGTNTTLQARRSRSYSHGSRLHNSTNLRLPPHPQPTLVHPLAQIGSSRTPHVINLPGITGQTAHSAKTDKTAAGGWQADVIVASAFNRGQLQVSRSTNNHDNALRRMQLSVASKGGQCLLVFNSSGFCTEHHLEPRPQTGATKVSDDSPIEMVHAPRFQWALQRLLTWNEVTLPLPPNNPLLEADNRRRARVKAQIDMASSVTSSLSSLPARSSETVSNVHENIKNDLKSRASTYSKVEDFQAPKTQQPISRNFKHGSPTNNQRIGNAKSQNRTYPGTAMLDAQPNKPRAQHSMENPIIPMGHHCDDHDSMSRDLGQTDHFNGEILLNHQRESEALDHRPSSTESGKSNASLNLDYDEWLAQVEMVSHEGPARRLWMGPQFCFKLRQSTGSTMLLSSSSSALLSNRVQIPTSGSPPRNTEGHCLSTPVGSHHDAYLDEELDLQSLKIQPNRSDPMPTPKSGRLDQYEMSSICIEAGSGSFDRSGHMLEIGTYGSLEDRRLAAADCEDKLREKIADAMRDSEVISAKSRDIRTKSDSSSDTVEFTAGSDVLLPVDGFDFDSEYPSLDMSSNT